MGLSQIGLIAKLALISVFCLTLTGQSQTSQLQEIGCECPTPPGGVCRCAPDLIAICKIVNKQCVTTCKSYPKNSTPEQLVTLVVGEALGERLTLGPGGTLQGGSSTSDEALWSVRDMLSKDAVVPRGQIAPSREALRVRRIQFFPQFGGSTITAAANVGLPTEVAALLRRANLK